MVKNRLSSCFWLLLPVLLSAFSWGLEAQESAGTENSSDALSRLIEISTQLSTLNEKLQSELQGSRQSSRELQIMLEASKKELEELRLELQVLRSTSAGLLLKAESSQTELTALLAALRKAESSLMSLELSFAAYRQSTEKRIATLEKRNRFWKWGCIGAGIFAAGLGTAMILGR